MAPLVGIVIGDFPHWVLKITRKDAQDENEIGLEAILNKKLFIIINTSSAINVWLVIIWTLTSESVSSRGS